MISAGELFAIPIPSGGFATGHVVLNIEDPNTRRLLGPTSRLDEHGALLLDVYGPVSDSPDPSAADRLIHGIWTTDDELRGRKRWKNIGTRQIDPTIVEFPEFVFSGRQPMFERGELVMRLSIPNEDLERVRNSQPFIVLAVLPKMVMNLTGRRSLLGDEAVLFDLKPRMDLRYSPYRDEVYKALGVDPKRGYWDWATAEGLDPGRFWR